MKSSLNFFKFYFKIFAIIVNKFFLCLFHYCSYLFYDSILDKDWGGDGSPIFFYAGNEGPIEAFWKASGFIHEIAPQFKAYVVFPEHVSVICKVNNSRYHDYDLSLIKIVIFVIYKNLRFIGIKFSVSSFIFHKQSKCVSVTFVLHK